MNEQMREAFEKWLSRYGYPIKRNLGGAYLNPAVNDIWIGWQAASSRCEGWRCFGCDFFTTDKAEALAHFGDRDDPEEFKPICKWCARMDDGERRETLQDTIQQLNEEQERAEEAESEVARLKTELECWNCHQQGKPGTWECSDCETKVRAALTAGETRKV